MDTNRSDAMNAGKAESYDHDLSNERGSMNPNLHSDNKIKGRETMIIKDLSKELSRKLTDESQQDKIKNFFEEPKSKLKDENIKVYASDISEEGMIEIYKASNSNNEIKLDSEEQDNNESGDKDIIHFSVYDDEEIINSEDNDKDNSSKDDKDDQFLAQESKSDGKDINTNSAEKDGYGDIMKEHVIDLRNYFAHNKNADEDSDSHDDPAPKQVQSNINVVVPAEEDRISDDDVKQVQIEHMNDRKLRKTLGFLGTSYYIGSKEAVHTSPMIKKEGVFRTSTVKPLVQSPPKRQQFCKIHEGGLDKGYFTNNFC